MADESAARPMRAAKDSLTEDEQQLVALGFVQSGNIAFAARVANVTPTRARTWVNTHWIELNKQRSAHKTTLVDDLSLVLRLALEELVTPERMKKATTAQLLMMTDQLSTKIATLQIAAGLGPSMGGEGKPRAIALSPEQRERAREIHRALQAGGEGAGVPKVLEAEVVESRKVSRNVYDAVSDVA